MMIIVNVLKEYYININNNEFFGKDLLANDNFIHASSLEQFPLIIPRLEKNGGDYMVLFIDTDKLKANVKWEYSTSLKQEFPHIYGEINKSAIIKSITLKEYINANKA